MGHLKPQKKVMLKKAGSSSTADAPPATATPLWRQKAIAMFPYHHSLVTELEDEEFSVYMLFSQLLPLCIKAHQSGSEWELQRIYDYAEWCWRRDLQGEDYLSYAVGVAFYEHLSEHVPVREIRKWVKPDIYNDLRELFRDTFTNRVTRVHKK